MKACVMKTALLVLLAGITWSASAKPSEARQWQRAILAGHQGGELMVAAGPATSALGRRRDATISASKRPPR